MDDIMAGTAAEGRGLEYPRASLFEKGKERSLGLMVYGCAWVRI